MLSFAAFVPHSPILIPEVGKENLDRLKSTIEAYKKLEELLYASKPDLLLLVSPHTSSQEIPYFSINQQPNLKLNFKKFGDLITQMEFKNDIGFGYKVKESCEDYFPIKLTAQEELDYGSGVPLFYLTKALKDISVVSIGYADLSYEDHVKFGEIIRKQINLSSRRIAVVASGDLAHKLHEDSPAGYSPRAQEFDQAVIKALEQKDLQKLLAIKKDLADESGECALRSILILMGIIKDINYQSEKLSYQSPFGIGYLVQNFIVK